MQEFLRGHFSPVSPSSWHGLRENCVRRRATLSVALNPNCNGAVAAAAVGAVLHRCMEDRSPFIT